MTATTARPAAAPSAVVDRLALDDPGPATPQLRELRLQARAFAANARAAGRFEPMCDSWHAGWDPDFSRLLAKQGWVGMTLPTEYGGAGRTAVERYVVVEELLAAGAPLAAHWAADRQMGPSIQRLGTAAQRARWLPPIARGECSFAIGMSEPDSGSDLASVRTRAQRTDDGWRLNGAKVWVTGGYHADALLVLARTAPHDPAQRHAGLSQLLVPANTPGVTVRPIRSLLGPQHLAEVIFTDVVLPADALLGVEGQGWAQVTAELAVERAGPERFLSTFPLVELAVSAACRSGDRSALALAGDVLAQLWTLRRMSFRVAARLDRGRSAEVPAALVKELGTRFEVESVDVARRLLGVEPDASSADPAARLLGQALRSLPAFTLRGGTNEILRGLIARGLRTA
ncbi:acyl-CoA dehydrogenase family protein [Pseudonocardia sp. CA-107938]|uniref:acyl-CoA dehydrogenase family protein n=1 Tax=Pseudonocardia sp. CA-107938 TaxID=3240021 RepID=UPI003D8ADCBC